MSIADMLGVEDNPFGLFLILILLLGATGHFDPAEKEVSAESASEGESKQCCTLPVWQTRPTEAVLVRPFSGPRLETARPCGIRARRKDLISSILDVLGLTRRKKLRHGLARVLRLRSSRHPLLQLWHKMQQ